MSAKAAAPASPAAVTTHSDVGTPIPAIDIDMANGAKAEVTCFAEVDHPSRDP